MRPDLTKAVDRPCVGRPARYNTQPFGEKAGISPLLLMLSHRPAGFSRKKQQETEKGIPVPKTAIAKAIALVRRILAPVMLGAMLPVLSLLASADAEAQTEFTPPQITIHIKANITRETDNRPPVQRVEWTWERITTTYSFAQLSEASGRLCEHGIDFDNGLACRTRQDVPFPPFENEDVFRTSKLCAQMGGNVGLQGQQEFCSNMDRQGTFCFVGSREVFPCRGLYKNVLRCNSINRPALNPFVCERTCPEGQFACGNGCWSGNLEPATRVLSVAPGYAGAVFLAATTLTVGEARFTSLTPGYTTAMEPYSGVVYGAVARVFSPSLPAGSVHAATLRAEFSCPELSSEHAAHAEWAFTLTALAQPPTTTLYYESGAGTGGGGKVTIDGVDRAFFNYVDITSYRYNETGEISLATPRPDSGESRTIFASATSREFGGNVLMTVIAEFRHPFHPDLGEGHCRVPDDSDYQALRRESCSGDAVGGYCAKLDDPLFDALATDGVKGDSDFCRALRNGANVNAFHDGDYPMALAATLNRIDIGEMLTLSGATIHSNDAEYGDALNYAAYAGSEKFARWLIVTVGASVNAQSGSGNKYAPVHMLGLRNLNDSRDSAAVARLMTLHGADLDAEVASGPNAGYRYASFLTNPRLSGEPDYRALSVLVSAGVNLAYGHPLGEEDTFLYPLDRAVKRNHPEVARVMLTRGNGIVNAVNDNGTTPIFHARTLEMVNLLIDAGADVNLIAQTSLDPTTPLDAMLNDYYPGHSDGNLLQAINRLKESREAQCLATHSNGRPRAVVNLCPNQVSCKDPDVSDPDARYYESHCILACPECDDECPPGYGSVPWYCPVDTRVRDASGGLDRFEWFEEKQRCDGLANSELSCLPR